MSEAIKHVMAQIFDVDVESIDIESSPDTIERWDSLKHMQLIIALEDELGIQFSDESIPELISFGVIDDTVTKLSAKLQ